ncbi:hypothetical protein MMC07_003968 [Pseudocyphellaria aurata]|nr:hypothetical protein [Pseudocyphellaria aurata]
MDPSNIPLGPPPPGVIPNFVNPESRAYETIITVTICLAFMMPFFLLRIYSRVFVTRSVGWDDYTCVIGVIGTVAFAGIFTNMLRYGYAHHGWDVTLGQFQGGLKYLLIYTLLYGPTIFFIKVSILILYLRVFAPDRRMRLLIYLGMGYTLLANSIVTILFGALCTPRKGQTYFQAYTRTQCVNNVDNLAIATSALNLFGDVYILIIPIPAVLKLQLSKKKRIAVLGVFMTGFLACAASLVAVIIRGLYGHNSDYTWWSPRLVYTTLGEMNIGIICACMPPCTAIFRDKLPSGLHFSLTTIKYWFSSSSRSTSESVTKVNESPDGSDAGRFHSHQDGYQELRAAEGSEKVSAPAPTLARSGSLV